MRTNSLEIQHRVQKSATTLDHAEALILMFLLGGAGHHVAQHDITFTHGTSIKLQDFQSYSLEWVFDMSFENYATLPEWNCEDNPTQNVECIKRDEMQHTNHSLKITMIDTDISTTRMVPILSSCGFQKELWNHLWRHWKPSKIFVLWYRYC